MRYLFAGILVITITLSIACNSQTDTIVVLNQPGYEEVNGISLDTLSKWKLYAESSDEGLWEGESNHYILLNRVITLGGEEDLHHWLTILYLGQKSQKQKAFVPQTQCMRE